ncbi:MAG: redoxin domain-containing protein [Planctomycetes bacterium]|nr:redoxin domain-containing protein [Planctomycetota bacterium]
MQRLIVWSLAGLILVPAAWAGGDKKNGNDKVFKIEGTLAKDDPADKLRKNPHKVHEYKMKAGANYVIDMITKNAQELDPYLRLEDSAGKNLAEDDDGGGFPNARIIFKAPKDDTYRIIATAFKGVGDYTLTVRVASEAQSILEQLKESLGTKQKELFKQFPAAKTEEARQKITDRFYELTADSLLPLSEFAQKYADDPAAKEAKNMVRNNLRQLEQSDSPGVGKVLRTLREKGPKEMHGQVSLALSQNLRSQYERSYQRKDKDAGKLLKEIEDLLKHVGENHADLASQVKDVQFTLKNLTVGRPAMEIEAEDLDTKTFKLSDYRGKVVVIDFWGHW